MRYIPSLGREKRFTIDGLIPKITCMPNSFQTIKRSSTLPRKEDQWSFSPLWLKSLLSARIIFNAEVIIRRCWRNSGALRWSFQAALIQALKPRRRKSRRQNQNLPSLSLISWKFRPIALGHSLQFLYDLIFMCLIFLILTLKPSKHWKLAFWIFYCSYWLQDPMVHLLLSLKLSSFLCFVANTE